MKQALTFIFQTLFVIGLISVGVWAIVDFYSFAFFIGKIIISIAIIGIPILLVLWIIAQIFDFKN
ncbi:MAG: hypothetical protein WCY89_01220 [Flavobacteriaceae bacterium]